MVDEDKTVLYLGFTACGIFLVYKVFDFFKPTGKEEFERVVKEVLNDINYEKNNIGNLPSDELTKFLTFYKTEAYAKWNYVKSLGFTMSPSPSQLESDISAWTDEEKALAWKMYTYNLLSEEGRIRFNDPIWDLAKTLGLYIIIGAVSAITIKKIIDEWKAPKPPGSGTVAISGNPGGATVNLSNGETATGVAPVSLDVAAGSYLLEVLVDGFATYRTLIDVVADQTKYISYSLSPLPGEYVRFVTPAGSPYGNVNELWFDVYRATKQVSFWEAGVFSMIIDLSSYYLDFIHGWNIEAWAYAFEVYYGHTYEYYYPPADTPTGEKQLDISTWELTETLIVLGLFTLAVLIIYSATLGRGVPVGSTIAVPTTFSGLISFLTTNFGKQYIFVVKG